MTARSIEISEMSINKGLYGKGSAHSLSKWLEYKI
jgi:hypothetical protein